MPIAAQAAEITVTPADGDKDPIISISGEIKKGDDARFRSIAAELSSAIVLLDSDGGAITPAMDIGRTIKLREYSTAVYKNGICASACALIWIAGTRRVVFEGGKVGFHASYQDIDGSKIQTGMGNALVGHYLSQLGFGEKAVMFATAAPPEKVLWLTSESASFAGIEYTIIPNKEDPPQVRSATSSPPASIPTTTPRTAGVTRPQLTPNAEQRPGNPASYKQWMGDAKQTLRSPDTFAQALKQQGYQASISYENPEMPMLTTGIGDEKIVVAFSGCAKDGCNYIQFIDYFTDVNRREADWLILESGRDESYSHPLWMQKENYLALYNYVVVGTDGITLRTFIENMDYFIEDNNRIAQSIVEFRKKK